MVLSKDEMRKYQNIWMWRRRLIWIAENGPCQVSIWSRKDEFRDKELKKCWVLCGDCHKEQQRLRREVKKVTDEHSEVVARDAAVDPVHEPVPGQPD